MTLIVTKAKLLLTPALFMTLKIKMSVPLTFGI